MLKKNRTASFLPLMTACGLLFLACGGGGGGSTTSNPPAESAPVITFQPQSTTVTAGQVATFSVAATGNPAPAYQWYRGGTAINGATSATYRTPATTMADNDAVFHVVVTNLVKSEPSNDATLTVNPAVTGTSVTRTWDNASITWNLDGNYTVGQYCTGDWYVVAPSGVTVMSTSHTDTQNLTRPGESSSKNPSWGLQGYSNIVSGYDASLHTALPVALLPGDSLVTTTIKTTPGDGGYSCNHSAAILTVVGAIPSANSFRPPYCRSTRPAKNDPLAFSLSDIPAGKWALLPKIPRAGLGSIVPDLDATLRKVKGPWLDHRSGSETGEIHPTNQMKTYGADVSNEISEAAAQLCLDYSDPELQELAKCLIQIGIDNYGIVLAGGHWPSAGGISSGRKFPIVFASIMLNDARMKTFPRKPVSWAWNFGEDGQTYYYDDATLPLYQGPPTSYLSSNTQEDGYVPVRGVKGWVGKLNGGDDHGDIALWRISEGDLTHQFAHEHLDIRQWDPKYGDLLQAKNEAYRICCTGYTWMGQALFMLLFKSDTGTPRNELISVWEHDAFFDYAFRWMSQDYSTAQALYRVRYAPNNIGGQQFTGSPLISALWTSQKSTFPDIFRTQP